MATKTKKTSKSKLSLTATIRFDNLEKRQKLRDYAEKNSISENAVVQQLVVQYLDKLDHGQRLDDLEVRVTRMEGVLQMEKPANDEVAADPAADNGEGEEQPDGTFAS